MNDYQRGQLDMRERCASLVWGTFGHIDRQTMTDKLRALPLTAPATEAGGLGAEDVAALLSKIQSRAEQHAITREDGRKMYPGWYADIAAEVVDALVKYYYRPAPEPDTLRERVERYADELTTDELSEDSYVRGWQTECNRIATELRALLQPPAREGGS